MIKIMWADLSSIKTTRTEQCDPNRIDLLAKSIVAVGGNIQPIVIQPIDFATYNLISGYETYQALLAAKKIDNSIELANAVIVPIGADTTPYLVQS